MKKNVKKNVEKKEISITVKDLHISYRGLKKFSIKRSFFKGTKNSKEIFEAVTDCRCSHGTALPQHRLPHLQTM